MYNIKLVDIYKDSLFMLTIINTIFIHTVNTALKINFMFYKIQWQSEWGSVPGRRYWIVPNPTKAENIALGRVWWVEIYVNPNFLPQSSNIYNYDYFIFSGDFRVLSSSGFIHLNLLSVIFPIFDKDWSCVISSYFRCWCLVVTLWLISWFKFASHIFTNALSLSYYGYLHNH